MSDLVGNPEDWFLVMWLKCNLVHIKQGAQLILCCEEFIASGQQIPLLYSKTGRTALARRFLRVPKMYNLSKYKKNEKINY